MLNIYICLSGCGEGVPGAGGRGAGPESQKIYAVVMQGDLSLKQLHVRAPTSDCDA